MRPENNDHPTAVLITGTVGAGKTSVAAAAGSILAEARIPHAVIDLDALTQSWPAPPDDPLTTSRWTPKP
jgi:Ni2+-binding GTPase involved in maturation of urease and hydrogenase